MLHHPILDQLAQHGVRLGLERISSFLQVLGEPHRAYPVVHVGGTNGKGSVCYFVTQALVAAGLRVGTTVSPHVEQVNERVMIDGAPIDDAALIEAIEAIDRARWDWARTQAIEGAPLTYFEFLIAVAFQVFAERQVDVAVVEVGLGGRLDATNVVAPVVCAIPTISFDHMDQLGSTLAEIAGEKAGIFKKGVPVVLGSIPDDARVVLETRALQKGCPLWRPPQLRREPRGELWNLATPAATLHAVRLGPQGVHQSNNALVALGVLHRLRELGMPISDEAIREGFAQPGLPGRLEWLRPGLLVDGAHNEGGTRALATWLGSQPRPASRILLFGMGQDRDPAAVVRPLLPYVDEVVTTRCAHPKAREPMDLALALRDVVGDVGLSAGDNIEVTLPEVYAEADEVIVAGSLFVVGAARTLVREGALDDFVEDEPGEA